MTRLLARTFASFAGSAFLACIPPAANAQSYVATGQNFGYGTGSGNGQLNVPFGVALDGSGNVFVGDVTNNRVVEFNSMGVFVQNIGSLGSGTGQLHSPNAVAIDNNGHLFVADQSNNRVVEFQVSGNTAIFIQNIGLYGSGNGYLNNPIGVTISGANLYVTDQGNYRVVEFQIAGAANTFVRNLPTGGTGGANSGQLSNSLRNIALDGGGNIYVADAGYDRLVKYSAAGAFLQNFYGSGTGNGRFNSPRVMAVDKQGNVYADDSVNNTIVEFNSAGAFMQTIGSYGVGIGQLSNPRAAAFDTNQNLYVTDTNNNRIVKFTRTSDASSGLFTGTITLEGLVADANSNFDSDENIRFEFRPKPSGNPIVVKQVLTASGADTGTFALSNIPFGTYDVAIKGACWLQKVIHGVTFSVSAPAVNINALLPAADLNNDNSVDVLDFGILVNEYGSIGDR